MAKSTDNDLQAAWDAEVASSALARDKNLALLAVARKDPAQALRLKAAMEEDLRRVSRIPRPLLGPSSSRARYRELGRYSDSMAPFLWGSWQEFQRSAGLRDTRNTANVQNRAAKLHTAQKIADYAEKELGPWKWEPKGTSAGLKTILIGSDFHSGYANPFAMRVWFDTMRDTQPDVVVWNGDVVDFPSLGRHRQLPGHFHWTLADEIAIAKEWFRKGKEAAPNAEHIFVIGNHEYRLVNYLADTAPALASLPSLSFSALFGLEELGIRLVCRSNFLAPAKKQATRDIFENWAILEGCYVVTHGTSLGQAPALGQLKRFNMSGTSGHTHRPQIFHENSLGTGSLSWMSTPAMASFAVGRDYVSTPTQWNCGFGIAQIMDGAVSQQIVQIHNTHAFLAGKVWTITPEETAKLEELGRV